MAKFIKSGTAPEHYPACERPEVAMLGRSNAGKSSLLNALVGQRLARKSSKPGHTALVNFFDVASKGYNLVDLPGYGFAKRSGSEQKEWRQMVESYLLTRECLTTAILVMDIRRDWSQDEASLVGWLQGEREIRILLALNKVDKLNQKEQGARQKYFLGLGLPVGHFLISAEKKKGVDKLETAFDLSEGTW